MGIIGGVQVRNQKVDLDLKKLKRADLLEMLIASEREREALELQLQEVTAKLESREILLQQAGSIAEAALRLNGVFEAAQAAADQYLENVIRLSRNYADGQEQLTFHEQED